MSTTNFTDEDEDDPNHEDGRHRGDAQRRYSDSSKNIGPPEIPGGLPDRSGGQVEEAGESEDGDGDCGCGQCEIWRSVVDIGRRHRVFDLSEWVALIAAFAELIHDGPAELAVDDYLDLIPDTAEEKMRDEVDGEVGSFFDKERQSGIAARYPKTFGCDVYKPMSTIERFDSAPNKSCRVLKSVLENRNSRSLFDRLQSQRRPDARQGYSPGTRAEPATVQGTRTGAAVGRPNANGPAKDCCSSCRSLENRRSERSDRGAPSLAVARSAEVSEVVENGGIRFKARYTVRRKQAQMIDDATRDLTDACHHFFVHAVRSAPAAMRKNDGWFPFYHEHIKAALPCTKEERNKTERVWRPLKRRNLIRYSTHSHKDGAAREYKVDENWLEGFLEAAFQNEDDAMVDAFTGATVPTSKRETRLYDHNDHKYQGSLYQGLQALKGATRRFNKQAVEDYLIYKKRKVVEARADVDREFTEDYREYKQAFFDVPPGNRAEGYSDTDNFNQWKLLYEGQKRTTAFLRHRQLRESYMNDLRCYASVLRQKPRHVEEEIWEYDTAWEPQEISGRVSEIGGGLQSASKEMKAAAYEGVEMYNWDIVGSQLGDVISATEMVPGIDTAELDEKYQTASTEGGDPKTENAEILGISRDTYKDLLYATVFVASWSSDASAALDQANPITGVPQTLKILRRAGWQENTDVQAAYERAQAHFLPLKKAVRKLADYLLTTYWEEHKYNAGGWVMKNDCGVAFRKSDYKDASTHKTRSKVLAWFLQGRESDKIHRLSARCQEKGIELMGNEHDGLVTSSPIPENIQEEVLKGSDLERKPFDEFRIEVEEENDKEEIDGLQNDIAETNSPEDADEEAELSSEDAQGVYDGREAEMSENEAQIHDSSREAIRRASREAGEWNAQRDIPQYDEDPRPSNRERRPPKVVREESRRISEKRAKQNTTQ